MPPVDTEQALWDLEDAAEYRDALRAASRAVQEADTLVLACRTAWHEAVAALATAQQAVTDWTLTTEPIPPAIFLQRLRVLDGEVARAEDAVSHTKGELNAARAKRGRLWDERRVKVRRKFERYPLEEWAQKQQGETNGHDDRTPSEENGHAETPAGLAAASSPEDHFRDVTKMVPQPEPAQPAVPAGEPWPGGLTPDVLRRAYVAGKLASHPKPSAKLPHKADPFELDGRLWVCIAESDTTADVLPLVPVRDFEECYPAYPTMYIVTPPPAGDREAMLQLYTGVVVKVGRKEYAIAPAGEQRTFLKP